MQRSFYIELTYSSFHSNVHLGEALLHGQEAVAVGDLGREKDLDNENKVVISGSYSLFFKVYFEKNLISILTSTHQHPQHPPQPHQPDTSMT